MITPSHWILVYNWIPVFMIILIIYLMFKQFGYIFYHDNGKDYLKEKLESERFYFVSYLNTDVTDFMKSVFGE